MLLEGKVAIISGVGGGLGRRVAKLFAAHGADLVLGARTVERCERVAGEVRELGRRTEVVHLDITDAASCAGAVAAATETFGGLDVLVNNAFHDGGGNHTTFEASSLSEWREMMDVNLWGTLQMTKAAVPAMTERGGGHVVMVNTMSAHRIRPSFGGYATSKGALETATKALATELGVHGIRVNGIHPGYIWSKKQAWWFEQLAEQRGTTADEVYRELADETSLKYLPDAEEIAGSVLFFASDLSRPVTGQSLDVNAGHWIG